MTRPAWIIAPLLLTACSTLPPPTTNVTGPETVTRVQAPHLTEISGLAASRRTPHHWWMHNDSGDVPRLYAVDSIGAIRATVHLEGATARDWEDLASFELNGIPWLLIADVGDNQSVRNDLKLYLLPEPAIIVDAPHQELRVRSSSVVNLAFSDGPRDCEGVAVCPQTNEILLLSKRTEPPVLYTLPLHPHLVPGEHSTQAARLIPVSEILPPHRRRTRHPGPPRATPFPSDRVRHQPGGIRRRRTHLWQYLVVSSRGERNLG